jgi:hypothetical protein
VPGWISDRAALDARIAAWTAARNAAQRPITGNYTIEDARRSMRHVYPLPQPDNER